MLRIQATWRFYRQKVEAFTFITHIRSTEDSWSIWFRLSNFTNLLTPTPPPLSPLPVAVQGAYAGPWGGEGRGRRCASLSSLVGVATRYPYHFIPARPSHADDNTVVTYWTHWIRIRPGKHGEYCITLI